MRWTGTPLKNHSDMGSTLWDSIAPSARENKQSDTMWDKNIRQCQHGQIHLQSAEEVADVTSDDKGLCQLGTTTMQCSLEKGFDVSDKEGENETLKDAQQLHNNEF